MNTAAEQQLYSKLKRQRLGRLLATLAGVRSGKLLVEWKNGSIRNIRLDQGCTDILNNELSNAGYSGKVEYRFHDQTFIELSYL